MSENPFESPRSVPEQQVLPKRGPWLRLSMAIFAVGILTGIAGVLYGVLLVGVPSPDAPLEVQRHEQFHLGVSKWIFSVGAGLMLLGLVSFLVILIGRVLTRIFSGQIPLKSVAKGDRSEIRE